MGFMVYIPYYDGDCRISIINCIMEGQRRRCSMTQASASMREFPGFRASGAVYPDPVGK